MPRLELIFLLSASVDGCSDRQTFREATECTDSLAAECRLRKVKCDMLFRAVRPSEKCRLIWTAVKGAFQAAMCRVCDVITVCSATVFISDTS